MKFKTKADWTKDKMIAHVILEFQGKSIDPESHTCMYRSPENKKCAVGMFIPNELYHSGIEGTSAHAILKDPKLYKSMPLESFGMQTLQGIHDGSKTDEDCLNSMVEWIEANVE